MIFFLFHMNWLWGYRSSEIIWCIPLFCLIFALLRIGFCRESVAFIATMIIAGDHWRLFCFGSFLSSVLYQSLANVSTHFDLATKVHLSVHAELEERKYPIAKGLCVFSLVNESVYFSKYLNLTYIYLLNRITLNDWKYKHAKKKSKEVTALFF